jgi:CubicO group peptidase (beta-lactamase class C family)
MKRLLLALVLVAACLSQSVAADVGFERLPRAAQQRIDALVADAIAHENLPGGQLVIAYASMGGSAQIVMRKAYGVRTIEPRPLRNDMSTIYEFASVSKAVATADAVMLLVQRGMLRLNDRVALSIPEFAQNGKHDVTIAQLLTHTGGMQIDYAPADYFADRATILTHAYESPLRFAPGSKFEYSDLAFIVLAEVVARVSGKTYEQFVQDEIFRPIGMNDTFFDTTIDEVHKRRLAPQILAQNEQTLRKDFGTVPGVNGHAGVLATADDIMKLCLALLGASIDRPNARFALTGQTVRAMLAPRYVGAGAARGLGWDMDSPYSGNRGDIFPRGGFGHTGSSGTSVWIDPALDVAIVFASNAHYPADKGSTLPLEAKIANVVASAYRGYRGEDVRRQEAAFDAAVARSALKFPATPGPPPTPKPSPTP